MSEQAVVTWVDLDSLSLWDKNYNQGDVGAITLSIQKFGFVNAVRVWRGTVMAGNHSIKAVRQLIGGGWQPYGGAIRVQDGGIQVLIVDISYIESETDAYAFAIADNRTASLADPDSLILTELLQEVANDEDESLLLATGYDGDDLDDLLRDLGMLDDPPEAPEAQVDRAEELRVKWDTKRGQIWQVGNHRIICGDSTDAEDVARLMDGDEIDLLLTDPPYGINVVQVKTGSTSAIGGAKPVTIGSVRHRQMDTACGVSQFGTVSPKRAVSSNGANKMVDATLYRPVHGDDKPFDPSHLMGLATQSIIFGGNYFSSKLEDSRCWIVWDKNNTGFFADAELAWTNFDRGVKLYQWTWNGLVRQGERDVEGVKRFHPTQKPVGLMSNILNDFSTSGDNILDLYLGAGAVLLACEQTGRVGYGMEIDPAYIAVCLERLTGMGLEATLLND